MCAHDDRYEYERSELLHISFFSVVNCVASLPPSVDDDDGALLKLFSYAALQSVCSQPVLTIELCAICTLLEALSIQLAGGKLDTMTAVRKG